MAEARRHAQLGAIATCVLLAACASLRGLPAAPEIDAERIRRDVAWLADDERGGRGPGSPGLDASADYLAEGFRRAGLTPGGESRSYFQRFEMPVAIRVKHAVLRAAGTPFERGRDFDALLSSESAELRAPLAFAGYGIRAPQLGYDDYAGLDVEGAIVLLLSDRPGGRDGPLGSTHGNGYLRRAYKVATARQLGAAAVLFAPFREDAEGLPETSGSGTANPTIQSSGIPVLTLSRDAAERIVAGGGSSLAELQREIDGAERPASRRLDVDVAIDVAIERRNGTARNVVAVLGGSDPGLRHEAVVVGAHYDHLGLGGFGSADPSRRGEVHNGADDNASGAAGLLELSRAFAHEPRPRRTLVFVAFAGEELGLLGSRAYIGSPTVPVSDTVAMLNLDMIGRMRDGRVTVFGSETSPGFPRLVGRATRGIPVRVALTPGGFSPSDQTSFYAEDVPVLFFFTGSHPEYHHPGDDAALLNAEGEAEVLAVVYRTARALLDAPERPEVIAAAADAHPGAAGMGRSYGPYLGTVPELSGNTGPGVAIQAVATDSPAERAGLRAGDRVVAFGGTEVASLEEYAALLFDAQPGQRVELVVLRQGTRIPLTAVLGERR